MYPIYKEKLSLIEIKSRANQLLEIQKECRICPRECLAKRHKGEIGVCNSTDEIVISSASPHFGEEPPLVGTNGSGTIFFSNCNLDCQFCQNYEISHLASGEVVSIDQLAEAMINLQNLGCHNINFVTPTHFTPQIVSALVLAIEKGFELPVVYNCGGYESLETLKLLDGIIDIYMPDMKYSDSKLAEKYSNAVNYWEIVTSAVKEMYRQVGNLKISRRGLAQRGLLIRHLVLPNNIAGSEKVLEFIAKEISLDTYVNIMEQYFPSFKAYKYPELNRRITSDEYDKILKYAQKLGLHRGFADF